MIFYNFMARDGFNWVEINEPQMPATRFQLYHIGNTNHRRPYRKSNTFKRILFFTAALLVFLGTGCTRPPENTNRVERITLDDMDRLMTRNDFTGFVVAMASWCPPCRKELPVLADLYRDYNARGIQIVAMSIDDSGPEEVQRLINKLKTPFPVYWVESGAISKYKIVGVPTLMVIRNGTIIEKLPGAHSKTVLHKKLDALIEGN